ncbi:MAG: hypothetical protein MK240_02340 [Opitutales bacterium]|nr:hypothetical protein [Opitutales bacterium]
MKNGSYGTLKHSGAMFGIICDDWFISERERCQEGIPFGPFISDPVIEFNS